MLKKLFSAMVNNEKLTATKGYAVYVNPNNVTYCEASGSTTIIYFNGGQQSLRVMGELDEVVKTLEKK